MYQAIIDDKVEFVELFLENGFSLKNFLTYRMLLKLYNSVNSLLFFKRSFFLILCFFKIPEDADLYRLFESRLKNKLVDPLVFNFKTIGQVISNLLDHVFEHKFTRKEFSFVDFALTRTILDSTVILFSFKKF